MEKSEYCCCNTARKQGVECPIHGSIGIPIIFNKDNYEKWYNEKLEKYKDALSIIGAYQMPKLTISPEEVTLENMVELTHCIQDMSGIANKALLGVE